jgi:hypothetical protein
MLHVNTCVRIEYPRAGDASGETSGNEDTNRTLAQIRSGWFRAPGQLHGRRLRPGPCKLLKLNDI